MYTPVVWEELLSTALLGTHRRRSPARRGSGLPEPVALLHAAAVSTVRRRAALRPAPAGPRPPRAPEDPRPPLPEAARRRLASLLGDREVAGPGGRRRTGPDLAELLPGWLAAARAHGYRAPHDLLPALLDAARARTDLRAGAVALGGPRALWLAGMNDAWRYVLRTAPDTTDTADARPPRDESAARRIWEEGLFAERVAVLVEARRRDAAAGRRLLESTWSGERAEDRLLFADALRETLSAEDEPFLERALSDRSGNVRATAAELLSRLPSSALARRLACRAWNCVTLRDLAGEAALVVTAPQECDAAMRRDGVVADPPAGRGTRSWWVAQLVGAAPLDTWGPHLGGLTAEQIVALPVADGWQADLHDAWAGAAVGQGDPEWARALLGAPLTSPHGTGSAGSPLAVPPPGGSSRDLSRLLAVLPGSERAAWVAGFVAAHGLSHAFQLLAVCDVPWSAPLGHAVIDALDIARDAGSYPWSFSGVMGLAERCLAPEAADRLAVLTALPEPSADDVPGAGGYWAETFRRLVATLRLRAAMQAELDGTAAPAAARGDDRRES